MRKPGEATGSARTAASTLLAFAIVALPMLMLLSCYPGEINNIEELDTIGTLYDPNHNYSAYKTYAMPDSVMAIDNRTNAGEEPPISAELQALMLSTVASNMAAFNYMRVYPDVDPQVDPDVGVTVGIIISDQVVVSVGYPWYGYWGWYGGWPGYGPGWGVGYPPTSTAYKYESGTATIDLIDLKVPAPTDSTVNVKWQGSINGLASKTEQVNADRIIGGINQAFDQSQYLKSTVTGVQ